MITRYFRHTTGTTIYAKKRPLSATWATGIIMGTENAATGEFSFSLSETSDYEIYLRVGGSPASSDTVLGEFEACCTQSSDVATITV